MVAYNILDESERSRVMKLTKLHYDGWVYEDFVLADKCILSTEGWRLSSIAGYYLDKSGGLALPTYLTYINPKTRGHCLAKGALIAIVNMK